VELWEISPLQREPRLPRAAANRDTASSPAIGPTDRTCSAETCIGSRLVRSMEIPGADAGRPARSTAADATCSTLVGSLLTT
jgi:hypothetical protein